jgi:DNA-binding SARP family transcriptional activator
MSTVFAERQEWEDAIRTCRAILARDNCWERAYRVMMTAYAQLGNRTQALRAYRSCEESLRKELDVAPSPATRRLHASILESTVAPDAGLS